jgi:8-oxo-dGTP pyrophosphatase MutT (NUDIX family)
VRHRPRLFNGQVLIAQRPVIADGLYRTTYFPVDYASFVSWRDFGWPDRNVVNGFAMAALRGADGAYVAGIMGAHTANAGAIYFAAGTPDLGDVLPDGRLDLPGSVVRELEEETGVAEREVTLAPSWHVVVDGCRMALMREAVSPLPAAALAARIDAFIAADPGAELAGTRIIRSPADIDEARMPAFMGLYLRAVFGNGR